MKKLFCVLTVVCMLASLVCVSALAGPDEHDEQILVAAEPTATNAEPTGKITVWSGNVGRDFTTDNTMAVIDVDELTAAIRNDLAANGIPTKYEIEAVATYVSGPSGNASWGFFREGAPVYMALWANKGSNLTNATFSDEKMLQEYVSASDTVLCLYSDNSGDVVNVQTLTLYAYRDTEPTATEAEPTLVGDANADGVINLKDVLVLRKYLADIPVEIDLVGADMTRDNTVNMKDVLALRLRIAYEKDAGEDEVPFSVVGELELGGNEAVWDLPRISVVRNRTELEMLAALNDEGVLKRTDISAFTDDYFKEHALLLIYHVSGCAPTEIAAFERLSDTSIYLRYTVPGWTQPWMVFAMQMVEFSAEDAANLKTIITPDESTTGISSNSEKTVSFPAVAPVPFWADFAA